MNRLHILILFIIKYFAVAGGDWFDENDIRQEIKIDLTSVDGTHKVFKDSNINFQKIILWNFILN